MVNDDGDADPPHPEEPCPEGVVGGLEDPQPPIVDPPEEPCAEAYCYWQATALAKVVWELDQKKASLRKLRASQKYRSEEHTSELQSQR